MIKGSMVAREIDLEEKRVFVPTPLTQEPYFSLPVVVAPIAQETAVPTPIVSSLDVAANGNEEPIPPDPIEPIAMDEGEQQQPPVQEMPVAVDLSRPQRIRRLAISDDYEIYNSKEIQMEDDPTSFEEAMRSVNSSEWTAAVDGC